MDRGTTRRDASMPSNIIILSYFVYVHPSAFSCLLSKPTAHDTTTCLPHTSSPHFCPFQISSGSQGWSRAKGGTASEQGQVYQQNVPQRRQRHSSPAQPSIKKKPSPRQDFKIFTFEGKFSAQFSAFPFLCVGYSVTGGSDYVLGRCTVVGGVAAEL